MASHEGRDGFTLLETLLAFVILSTALAISAQTIAIATRSLAGSQERTEVVQLVDSLRAETLPGVFKTGRSSEGTSGTYRWKASVRPTTRSADKVGVAGFAILEISAPSGRKHSFLYFSPVMAGSQ